ncbi:hypothetical protein BJX66DRAFT_305120 [Aspergillus keveii]|uniref:Zn(2)-C6 fungal-type domain-containing protein n=1 Tax=Aspergillus keveii TaxID=714993 RepID=A0ABR4G4K1_9EURO
MEDSPMIVDGELAGESRLRVLRACDRCSQSKQRCDGERPCQRCTGRWLTPHTCHETDHSATDSNSSRTKHSVSI